MARGRGNYPPEFRADGSSLKESERLELLRLRRETASCGWSAKS
jgi:hypothetical protein